jgi:C4-dicarboxylate transporter DctM subunit
MFALVIFVVFCAIAIAGVPLMYALLATTVGMIWINNLGHPIETIFLSFIGGVEPFILIAVPLFIFGGELLSKGVSASGSSRSPARFSDSCPGASGL